MAAVVCLLPLACASGSRTPYEQEPPVVRSISDLYQRLDKATAPQSFINVQTLGEVTYGNYKAPVKLYSIYNRSGFKKRVFLSGGMHGNEPAGVETLAQFIESLARNPSELGSISFDIVPVVNPWGFEHDQRFNGEGRDVNRDFASFKSQESKIIDGYLKGQRYDLMLDHHEDPDGSGFYMYQYAMPDQVISRQVIGAVRSDGYPIEQNVNMVILKTEDGLIDAPLWGLWYMQATGQLSFPNWSRLNGSETVYTIETPTKLKWEGRLQMHSTAREMIQDNLIKGDSK